MNPKEKAIKLLSNVKTSLTEKANKDDMLWEMTVHYQTIDIVLLMTKELIDSSLWAGVFDGEFDEHSKEYWQEVEKEVTVLASIP
jgi:spermidine/putrescine-binding protein